VPGIVHRRATLIALALHHMIPRGRGAGWDPPHPPHVLLGGALPRSQAKRLRERQGKRKEAVKGAWGRPRRGVATGRRWPVASRRLADACVAAYVGGWSGQQGAALALASRAVWMGGPVPPGGALAAPRRAARPARQGRGATVFCVAFRVVPESSSSSAPLRPSGLAVNASWSYGAGGRTHKHNSTCTVLRKFTEENGSTCYLAYLHCKLAVSC